MPLSLRLADPCADLLLDHLACGLERLLKVHLLLVHLVTQAHILLLDTLDKDVRELAHILQLRLDALQLGRQLC